jgi:predicted nucleic acid-binding protein
MARHQGPERRARGRREGCPDTDRCAAFRAWARHIAERWARKVGKRPVADMLIGALALRHNGLITRNRDFLALNPELQIVDPMEHRG